MRAVREDQHGTSTGYAYGCRCDTCRGAARAHNAAYNATHREQRVAHHAAYNAAHREERHAYYAVHREEIAAYQAAYAAHRGLAAVTP